MAEISAYKKQIDWGCRILIVLDMLVVLSGYFSWFRTKYQLVSPLIPRSTVSEIFLDIADIQFKYAIVAAVIFTAGLLLYSFGKKILALWFFSAVLLFFLLNQLLFRM
ncbi:MAG: hypothetical protein KAX45_07690 [Chitinophagaceae bacterium]|nr:hypothetical protein [Chitinophagaceae bacterium]MBP6590334.1 hypothetical protein [Chitinophagaceae bacterium]MBP8244403.1 hypothetical protein [Chitinophagaceae bacterium]